MIRRHPHVFGDDRRVAPAWRRACGKGSRPGEGGKRAARIANGLDPEDHGKGYLDGVPVALPALTRALKLQEKAARVGFDWKDAKPILDKIEEEIAELSEAIDSDDRSAVEDEFGDVLFALVNFGRHLKIDPEKAVRGTNEKFRTRLHAVERALEEAGSSLEKPASTRWKRCGSAPRRPRGFPARPPWLVHGFTEYPTLSMA